MSYFIECANFHLLVLTGNGSQCHYQSRTVLNVLHDKLKQNENIKTVIDFLNLGLSQFSYKLLYEFGFDK